MNENMFEVKNQKSKVVTYIIVTILVVLVGLLLILKLSAASDSGPLKTDDAIILNDIPSQGCVTLFCGQYKKLGYDVSYYVAGTDFDAGLYSLEINFDDPEEENQYMVVQTSNSDNRKYPYADNRFISLDLFGGIPANGNIVINNLPLVKDSDFEILYKNGFTDTATLTPQSDYVQATVDGGVNNQGYYPVGESIEPGTYQISYVESEAVPMYTILNENNSSNKVVYDQSFTLNDGDTLVLSQNSRLTKI